MDEDRHRVVLAMQVCSILLSAVLIVMSAQAQMPATASNDRSNSNRDPASRAGLSFLDFLARARAARRARFSLMTPGRYASTNRSGLGVAEAMTSGSDPAVHGSGTVGQIPKWAATSPSGNSILGDSIITEFNGNIGIGLATPGSKLSVLGMIETTLGGYKFPDGTVQTTAAVTGLTSVAHGSTLTGNGTAGSPLDVALPLKLVGENFGFPLVTIANTATDGEGLFVSGPFGLVVEASLGDGIIAGGGTGSTGVSGRGGFGFGGVVGGAGMLAEGGGGIGGGPGIKAVGGNADDLSGVGGAGMRAVGGSGPGNAGDGLVAQAGFGGGGGVGVRATGGDSADVIGGTGVLAAGGASGGNVGGIGVSAFGGTAQGHRGGVGIFAEGGAEQGGNSFGLAAELTGNVDISGFLSKASGSFKIDHPLDPGNKYLYHSFVESPDMKNIYDGVVKLDANGEAIVELPEWFGALNKDFRYLLTPIGAPSPMLYIAEEISDNRFKIAGGTPGMKVSWQVTGIRQDAYANAHRIKVEEDKPEPERGYYLHPELFNQAEELGVQWARHPELMRQIKETRLRKIEEMKQKASNQ
jgi:hypothetical protein